MKFEIYERTIMKGNVIISVKKYGRTYYVAVMVDYKNASVIVKFELSKKDVQTLFK